MLGWNLTHHFKTTTELAFPSSEVIQLLHDHQSLILSNPEVVEVQRSDKDASIWIVTSKISSLFGSRTSYEATFEDTERGVKSRTLARMGVKTEGEFQAHDSSSPSSRGEARCTLTEVSSFTSPFYVYPLVLWSYDEAHKEIPTLLRRRLEEKRLDAAAGTAMD